MKVLKTSPDETNEDIIFEAINVLADGGVILYPTDTVYGLGANIFDIKNRSFLKPLSIIVRDINAINLVAKISLAQKSTIRNYLPGPYTFILNKRNTVPRYITGGAGTVGIRVPDCELACRLASIFPITTTSANLSDDEVLSNPGEILDQLGCEVDLVIDAGDLNSRNPSSIIDLSGFNPKIIRK